MSIEQLTGGVQALANKFASGQSVTNRLAADLGVANSGGAGYWIDTLRPASFRGFQFGVLEGQLRFGRRSIIHEYPFRDTVWVEDLGRAARRVAFTAFIVGDDCIAQRDQLIALCEDVGAVDGGELVHPTLGRMTVSLAETVSAVERWDRGRYFEIGFSFIEQGKRIFPNTVADTGSAVDDTLGIATAATTTDFLNSVAGALKSGLAVAAQAAATVATWARAAQRLVNDATNLYHMVQTLPGDFGRLFGGNAVRSTSGGATVQSLVALGAVSRANVAVAGNALAGAAGGLVAVAGGATGGALAASTAGGAAGAPINGAVSAATSGALTAYANAAHGLATAVATASPSPPDALRLISGLISAAPALPGNLVAPTYPSTPVFPTPSAQAVALMAGASADLFRRAGVIALVRAVSAYTPTSYDDAAAVRAQVTRQLDAEILIAADQGQDDTYIALRDVRTAIVNDLTTRATSLASLVVVKTPLSVPAPVLSQRLYRDSTRADELVAEASPIHPAFMPVAFKALAR